MRSMRMGDGLVVPAGLTSQASRLAGGRIAAAAVSALWFVVVARSLSVDDFGSLALLLGLGMMLSIVTDLGLSNLLADAVARDRTIARDGTRIVIVKRLGLTVCAALLVAAGYLIAQGEGGWEVPAVFAITMLANSAYSTFTAVFRASGHAGIEGINEVASRVVVLALGWIFLSRGAGLLGVVGVYAAVDLLSLGGLGLVFDRLTRGAHRPIEPGRLALRRAKSLASAGIITTIYFRIDTWLVALIKGPQVVGRYAAAYRCFDALLIPATAVGALSIPHTSGLEGRALQRHLWRLVRLSLVFTAPLAVAVILGADPLLTGVFGAKYAGAADTLRLLACGALLTAAVVVVLGPLALRSSRASIALGFSLFANIGLNLIAIPRFGSEGAAMVTVACELFLATFLCNEVRRLTKQGADRVSIDRMAVDVSS